MRQLKTVTLSAVGSLKMRSVMFLAFLLSAVMLSSVYGFHLSPASAIAHSRTRTSLAMVFHDSQHSNFSLAASIITLYVTFVLGYHFWLQKRVDLRDRRGTLQANGVSTRKTWEGFCIRAKQDKKYDEWKCAGRLTLQTLRTHLYKHIALYMWHDLSSYFQSFTKHNAPTLWSYNKRKRRSEQASQSQSPS